MAGRRKMLFYRRMNNASRSPVSTGALSATVTFYSATCIALYTRHSTIAQRACGTSVEPTVLIVTVSNEDYPYSSSSTDSNYSDLDVNKPLRIWFYVYNGERNNI